MSLTVWPIRGAGDEVVGASVVARDLTGQRRAEQARQRIEARWRAIIESAVDGIIVIDRQGTIEFFNPAAERLFGYPQTKSWDATSRRSCRRRTPRNTIATSSAI